WTKSVRLTFAKFDCSFAGREPARDLTGGFRHRLNLFVMEQRRTRHRCWCFLARRRPDRSDSSLVNRAALPQFCEPAQAPGGVAGGGLVGVLSPSQVFIRAFWASVAFGSILRRQVSRGSSSRVTGNVMSSSRRDTSREMRSPGAYAPRRLVSCSGLTR